MVRDKPCFSTVQLKSQVVGFLVPHLSGSLHILGQLPAVLSAYSLKYLILIKILQQKQIKRCILKKTL